MIMYTALILDTCITTITTRLTMSTTYRSTTAAQVILEPTVIVSEEI